MKKIGWHWRSIGPFICSLVLTSGVLSAKLSEAATYYVAKTGSSSYSCAQAQNASTPILTIKSGIPCLKAGDTLIVKAGTYAEGVVAAPMGGTATNRITIKANPGDTVVVTKGATTADTLLTFTQASQSYVTVEGIIFDGQNSVLTPVRIQNVTHVYLRDVTARNGKGQGILSGTNANSSFLQFINLKVHDNGSGCASGELLGPCHGVYLSGDGHLIDGGEYYNNDSRGIQLYSHPSNVTVRNAKFYNNGHGLNVLGSGTGNKVYNNLIYGNAVYGMLVGSPGAVVANNTVYNNTQTGISISGSGIVVRNNITFSNGNNIQNNGTSTVLSNNLRSSVYP